ncbi:MAG: hypothetical protein QN120_12110 [Armatimonadota bacterium]|nr:hypothetical protein [Armatimonadota bacterium]
MRDLIETRRQILDTLRAGPALFGGLPGDLVDLERLAAHLARRGVHAAVHVSDGTSDGVLWIEDGGPAETWFFETGGPEAVFPFSEGRDLLRQIVARGGTVSVYVRPAQVPTASRMAQFRTVIAEPPAPPPTPAEPEPMPAPHAPIEEAPEVEGASEVEAGQSAEPPRGGVQMEPPSHPWPGILAELLVRVERSRGPRLATLYRNALAKALSEHGGRLEEDRIIAPPLSESVWRQVVERGCEPIVLIAGRAFLDRMIAASERHVVDRDAAAGE